MTDSQRLFISLLICDIVSIFRFKFNIYIVYYYFKILCWYSHLLQALYWIQPTWLFLLVDVRILLVRHRLLNYKLRFGCVQLDEGRWKESLFTDLRYRMVRSHKSTLRTKFCFILLYIWHFSAIFRYYPFCWCSTTPIISLIFPYSCPALRYTV
jgi:hypothetical protein